MKCPYCESENIEKGSFIASATPFLFSLISKSLFKNRNSTVSATVCLECGKLFDFEVDNLSKLTR